MAKKKKTTRIYQLAKKLGVRARDIVAKCESEGIAGITNHMSVVSAGLAATISAWFNEDTGRSFEMPSVKNMNIAEVKVHHGGLVVRVVVSQAAE